MSILELVRVRARAKEREAKACMGVGVQIEAEGWERWCKHYFPDSFSRPFTRYQGEFWQWGWDIQPDTYYRPRVECEPRGVGKSTNAETLAVALLARKRRAAIGYVSREATKATQHFGAIKRKLENPRLLEAYSHLKPRIQTIRGATEQWSQEALVTAAGQMVIPISLLGSKRGFKSKDDLRFDLIILDDIDDLKESPELRAKILELLKSDIIAAGTDNTVIVVAQNLIHRDSICAQILDHRADILSDRIFSGPFPLLKWYDAEKEELPDGARRWRIKAGETFDPAIPLEYGEKLLNKFGKKTFDRECQQKVHIVDEDNDFREWDEVYHIVTRSEVLAGFLERRQDLRNARGELCWPDRFHKGNGLDWGTTRGHPSACVFVTRPAVTYPFSDCQFVFGETVLPRYPYDLTVESELVSPGRVAQAIRDFMLRWNIPERGFEQQRMSHEASAALYAFLVDLPDEIKVYFNKWKAQKGSGVPQIQRMLEVNPKRSHPFRKYPAGHPNAGQPLEGAPRLFFVVEDGQGELYVDDVGEVRVIGARNAEGLARLRYEIPLYNHRNNGERKIDDDAVDALRGLMATFGVSADRLTEDEKIDAQLADGWKLANKPDVEDGSWEWDSWRMARENEIGKIKKKQEQAHNNPWKPQSPLEQMGGNWGKWGNE
jgi:hypothetical protein